MSVSSDQLLRFLRSHRLAVQASVSPELRAQAAVVGFAVSDRFEIVFDTVESTRKARNLRSNQHVALVVGGLMPGDDVVILYAAERPARCIVVAKARPEILDAIFED